MKSLILFFSVVISTISFSQTDIKFGFELGTSFASVPIIKNEARHNTKSKEKILPILGPVLGVKTQLNLKKHFHVSIGLHYQYTGVKKQYTSKGTSPDYYPIEKRYTFSYEDIDKKTFHKINIPISIGFKFNVLHAVQPAFFIGYTPNFYVHGTHYMKATSERSNGNNYSYESKSKPLDSEQNYLPAKTYHSQFTVGFSLFIKEKFAFNVSYNHGQSFIYSKNQPGWCGTALYANNSFSASDLGLSVVYFIK